MWRAAYYSAVSYLHVFTERAIMCTVQSHGSSQGYSHKMSAHSVENLIKSGNPIVSSKFMDCFSSLTKSAHHKSQYGFM